MMLTDLWTSCRNWNTHLASTWFTTSRWQSKHGSRRGICLQADCQPRSGRRLKKHEPQLQADGTRFDLFYSADGSDRGYRVHFLVFLRCKDTFFQRHMQELMSFFEWLLTILIIFPQRGCIMLTSPLKSRDKAKISRFRYFFWKWLIFTLQWYTKFRQNAKLLPKFIPKICKNFGANNC